MTSLELESLTAVIMSQRQVQEVLDRFDGHLAYSLLFSLCASHERLQEELATALKTAKDLKHREPVQTQRAE